MILFLATLVYLGLHLGCYALVFRRLVSFRSERTVFLLHAGSFFLWVGAVALAGLAWLPRDAAAGSVVAAGLHGIYSLTFLELWSLTEGSYSLAILAAIARNGGRATDVELAGIRQIGAAKQGQRIVSLQRLRLIQASGKLSATGWLAARALRTILCVSNGKVTN